MEFHSKEVCMVHGQDQYTLSVCFNGTFYQARVINPPSPMWREVGIGTTENEAITFLMTKLKGQLISSVA